MFVNTSGGGKTQQQQPLQNQTNAPVRHNNPYPHSLTQQQPHYDHHQVTFVPYPFCNVAPPTHGSTGGNNVAVSGGQAGHMIYQAPHQPQSQPHPTQQHVGLHSAEQALQYFTKGAPLPAHHLQHAPQQHSQIRNMIAAVSHQGQSYVVSPNYFALSHALLPQQTRPPILANAAPQHGVVASSGGSMATQLQNTAPRNVAPSGPPAYVQPPYCTPPLLLGAAPTPVTPQPPPLLTTATGMGQSPSLQAYSHISSGLSAAQTSSTPINIQTVGLGVGTSTNIEHNTNTKQRKHAIPIVHPDTFEVVLVDRLVDVQHKPQPQSEAKTKISVSVESVSIQTDNDKSLTASIASDPSEAVLPTPSQSISATDTDKIEFEIQCEQDDCDADDKQHSSLEIASIPLVSVPEVRTTTHSQSQHTGSESQKVCAYEDPNDTDADTNEHELDNEDDVPDASDINISVAYIDHQIPAIAPIEQPQPEEIPNTDTLTLDAEDSEVDHSTETEVKSKDEQCATSVQTSLDRNVEEKSKESRQDVQPAASSFVVSETKRSRKNRKTANKRKEKNQNKLRQQQNKSSNIKNIEKPNKEDPLPKLIRYSLKELKSFANSSESRRPPVVPCQKGDCISQLFVPRQLHHHTHLSHQISQNLSPIDLQHHAQQSYHHMNFSESIEFITGKRRLSGAVGGTGSTARKNQEHLINTGSSGNNIAGLQGSASVGSNMTQMQKEMHVIHINLSLNEEIKLSECKNAWQPKIMSSNSNNNSSTPECAKSSNEDIQNAIKKVRGILNKLTSENFDVLLKEMTSINVNTQEKMEKIMLLIFEKTVNEPNFAPTYAKFSKVLFEEVKAENKGAFNALLISRLEKEFESNVNNPDAKDRKLQKMINKLNETKDQQEKIQLQAEIEHQEYQFRRRAWGTVRFIGEMYKLHSLSSNRVLLCVESLLDHGNEEKLEYMCKLLTTVGNLLESGESEPSSNSARMNKIFSKIQTIVKEARDPSNKKNKICSRVRFMMQDLIDLRYRNWGQPSYPQSSHIAAIRRRLPDDKSSNLPSSSSSTYERSSSQRMSFGNNNRNNQTRARDSGMGGSNGNYYMAKTSKPQYSNQREQQSIDVKKLNFSRGDDSSQANTKLGNKSIYMWRTVPGRQTSQSNDLQQSDRNSPTSSQSHKYPQNKQQSVQYSGAKNSNSDCSASYNKKLMNHLMEEYLDCLISGRWKEEVLNIWQETNAKQQICFMYYILMNYLHAADVKHFERNACANIFIYLMSVNAFSKTSFNRAYEQFAEGFPDVLLDVPNGWTYLFQFVGPLLHERLITFSDIWHADWRNDIPLTERFVNAFVAYFTKEFGANYMRDLWHKEFKLDQGQLFKGHHQEWHKFVTANKLQFLYDCKIKPEIAAKNANNDSSSRMDEHLQRLKIILENNDSNLALDYINTNVNVNEYFVKSLTRFLCCDYATTTNTTLSGSSRASSATTSKNSSTCSNTSSSSSNKNSNLPNNNNNTTKRAQLNMDAFRKNCLPLLHLCLDGHEDNEINCLDSVVDAMQQQFDTNTANELICLIFDNFYDCEVIAKESFEKWYKQRQQEQKKHISSAKRETKRPLSSHLETYMQKRF